MRKKKKKPKSTWKQKSPGIIDDGPRYGGYVGRDVYYKLFI
jgi:hypothetical protein